MKHRKVLLFVFSAVLALFSGIIYASAPAANQGERYFSPTERNPLYEGEVFLSDLPALLSEVEFGYSAEIPYREDLLSLPADIRQQMVDREETIQTGWIATEEYDWQNLARELFAAAVDHTGNPKEGDMLAWAWRDREIAVSVDILDEVQYVTFTYVIHYYTTSEMEAEFDAAVDALLSELDLWEKSDYEKIKGIYDYICANVEYDYSHVSEANYTLKYTPYAALIHKTAVCQGFATLYYRLAAELGVDSRVIFGTSNSVNHTWMIVQLGDLYFYLDPTWDRGKVEYTYFLKGEGDFNRHTRVDNPLCGMLYTSPAFYAAYPVAEWNYTLSSIPDEGVSGVCGDGVFWRLSADGRLRVYGEGDMEAYGQSVTPWSEYAQSICDIVIDRGISGIGDGAFYDCIGVNTVVLPNDAVRVGEDAFSTDTTVLFAEKKALELEENAECTSAQSPIGTRYAVFDRIPSDLLMLGQFFKVSDNDRLCMTAADGSRQLTRADSPTAGVRVQLLDEKGGAADELSVALWGDFDLDGTASEGDAAVLLWSFLKPEKYASVPHYDVNGDGSVNASDAACMGEQ